MLSRIRGQPCLPMVGARHGRLNLNPVKLAVWRDESAKTVVQHDAVAADTPSKTTVHKSSEVERFSTETTPQSATASVVWASGRTLQSTHFFECITVKELYRRHMRLVRVVKVYKTHRRSQASQ